MIRLKICGVRRAEDLRDCAELGVDFVGLNFWPGSSRYVDVDAAERLLAGFEGPSPIGVFVDPSPAELAGAIDRLRLAWVQLHGDADPGPLAELAAERGAGWVQVIRGVVDLDTVWVEGPAPSWVLLDAAVAGYGGAGRRTDWAWAARAVAALHPTPVWLAGGIDPSNAAQALAEVHPAGLDVASGAETAPGIKSKAAIASLRAICNNASS